MCVCVCAGGTQAGLHSAQKQREVKDENGDSPVPTTALGPSPLTALGGGLRVHTTQSTYMETHAHRNTCNTARHTNRHRHTHTLPTAIQQQRPGQGANSLRPLLFTPGPRHSRGRHRRHHHRHRGRPHSQRHRWSQHAATEVASGRALSRCGEGGDGCAGLPSQSPCG